MLLAVVLPVYTANSTHAGLQPRHSLVRVFGYRVLMLVAIPFVVSIVVGLLLHLRRSTSQRWPGVIAWALIGATLFGAIAGTVTFIIGIYVLPVGVLLCIAARLPKPSVLEQV